MIDFDDPTTWDQPIDNEAAISLGIWAINTLKYPDASSDSQFAALDFFGEGATETLAALRERLKEQGPARDPAERTHKVDMYGDPMPTDFMVEPCDNDGEGGTCSVCGSEPSPKED